MRVVAGSAKGVRLAPVPSGTRPVSDRAREGLFSSLGDSVEGGRILDLFAGTGAMGIEALSRGASEARFVDENQAATRTILRNLELTGLIERGIVHRREAGAFLRGAPEAGFDLCFLDPPYAMAEQRLEAVLASLAPWLNPGWTVVLTRPSKGYTPVIPVDWGTAKRLGYGDALLFIYREV